MQQAMEQQAAAERERKAMVTRAEGEKRAAILEAEARLEAAKRDADAQVMLAQASAEALRRVGEAVGPDSAALWYLLGEKYVASSERLAAGENAKFLVLPADLPQAVAGLFARGGIEPFAGLRRRKRLKSKVSPRPSQAHDFS